MFDIGFSELTLIAVVALIVLGPDRLPKAARTMGHLFGRLQRYVNDVKADINREMELEELRKLQQQMKSAARDIETSVSAAAREVEAGARGVEADLAPPAAAAPATDAVPAVPSAPAAPAPTPAAAQAAEPARQQALPGFDKI
jgi:sec-independent protein translocase protein TatB